jgi:hypothetical protein
MNVFAPLLLFCCLFVQTASGPLTVSSTEISNSYPESVTFQIAAASTAGAITSVEFNLRVRGASSTLVEPAEFTPGSQTIAHYTWATLRRGIAPGTPAEISWTVRDDAGNALTTEPEQVIILDSRFTWQMLESDDIALWWYAGDEEFAQHIFDSATEALAAMKEHTEQPLPFRIHVVLYADEADFDAWHSYVREWVGGEAYPPMGLTIQIIPPGDSKSINVWIEQVIPHEIAHLFFYQVTNSPLAAAPPTWLTEGFAQYHEFVPWEDKLDRVRTVARQGDLISLRLLSGSFSGDGERIALQYAESLSAVAFLFEQWGDEGMATLLAAYRAGRNTDQALQEAIGLDFEGFQAAWWEWLGGEPGAYPTRTAHEMPEVPPLATPRPVASPVPTQTPTSAAIPGLPLTMPPVPSPTAAEPTASPPTATGSTPESPAASAPCPGPLAGLVLVALASFAISRGSLRKQGANR